MQGSYIWSESSLLELINHPEPEVRSWAAETYCGLYPEAARREAMRLLEEGGEAVQKSVLKHLGDELREELIAGLKRIYMEGPPSVSALAVFTLGKWKVAEAVDWMKNLILEKKPLSPEQVDAMLFALGLIPGENAYEFLKSSEQAVQEKKSARWEVFYAAVLRHKRAEDVDTLVGVFVDRNEAEEQRRRALGLLLAQVEPGLNPAEVFFSNRAGVLSHLNRRLDTLRKEAAGSQGSERLESLTAALEELIESFDREHPAETWTKLDALALDLELAPGQEQDIFRSALGHFAEDDLPHQAHFGLACLALLVLMEEIFNRFAPAPAEDADWRRKLDDLLKDRPPREYDPAFQSDILARAPRSELLPPLTEAIERKPLDWGATRAVEMLGKLEAVEACEAIIRAGVNTRNEIVRNVAEEALVAMGPTTVPKLLPLLDSADQAKRSFALSLLGRLPTQEAVAGLESRLEKLLESDTETTLAVVGKLGAEDFLPLIEKEYRPGEWALGKAYVHICRLHRLSPPRLHEIERDARKGAELLVQHESLLKGISTQWPTTIELELACRECGRRYHYQVSEVHLHPHESDRKPETDQDATPYRFGVVIRDDLRCKNCNELNPFELTPATFSQITAESLKLLAFQRSGLSVPQYYPLKYVQLPEKEAKSSTLPALEQEHLDRVLRSPEKPQTHLALAKFYEYVKLFVKSKQHLFKALDVDSGALEGMAGLARIYHAEGRLAEACDWIERCYKTLATGRIYLTDNPNEFKSTVRQKRREFARELGIRLEDEPVPVRFKLDMPDYPKNRPCPCGSGKKYKLCCMNRD